MAIETGTATDYLDLLDKLRIFATGLTGGEAWTALRWVHDSEDDGHELILQGPGLAGLNEIIVGIKTYRSVASDYYNWKLQGYIGFNAALDFDGQPGAIPSTYATPRVCLWSNSIPYWFVGSGRRLIAVAKVSTVYEALYLGFIRPHGTPGQYPYPLAVGGSSVLGSGERWSVQYGDVRHFVDPGGQTGTALKTTLRLRSPGGVWLGVMNHDMGGSFNAGVNVWPYYGVNGTNRVVTITAVREGLDGTYPMAPLAIHTNVASLDSLGELDGCYHVSGFNNAAENIVVEDAVDHLVVQNVYRTGPGDYWALRLE